MIMGERVSVDGQESPGSTRIRAVNSPFLDIRNREMNDTVDGRNPANQLIGVLSQYFQGLIHPRWCRISSINRACQLPQRF